MKYTAAIIDRAARTNAANPSTSTVVDIPIPTFMDTTLIQLLAWTALPAASRSPTTYCQLYISATLSNIVYIGGGNK